MHSMKFQGLKLTFGHSNQRKSENAKVKILKIYLAVSRSMWNMLFRLEKNRNFLSMGKKRQPPVQWEVVVNWTQIHIRSVTRRTGTALTPRTWLSSRHDEKWEESTVLEKKHIRMLWKLKKIWRKRKCANEKSSKLPRLQLKTKRHTPIHYRCTPILEKKS